MRIAVRRSNGKRDWVFDSQVSSCSSELRDIFIWKTARDIAGYVCVYACVHRDFRDDFSTDLSTAMAQMLRRMFPSPRRTAPYQCRLFLLWVTDKPGGIVTRHNSVFQISSKTSHSVRTICIYKAFYNLLQILNK